MININSKIIQKILDLFFSHEDENFYLNEIVKKLNADKRNLVRSLNSLENEGVLKTEHRGNLKFYSLNKSFSLYNEYKKITLSTFGFDKNLKNILQDIEGIEKVYIFGSYAKNGTDASSDIDVLIIGDHKNINVQKAIAKLQKKYNREINIINIGNDEFKKKKNDPFIKQVMSEDKIELI